MSEILLGNRSTEQAYRKRETKWGSSREKKTNLSVLARTITSPKMKITGSQK